MILPKKIRTLKPRVQLRKVGDIFHEAASHGMDDAYLEEVLGIALGSDLLDEDGRERLRSFFSRHDSISFDDIYYYLLSVLGDVPADWDASGDDGDVDWTRRTVFPHVLYLDHIRSPYNVGSIFRSAEAFGVESIIIAPGTASPEHPRAARTSRGTCSAIPWREAGLDGLEDMPVFALETGGEDIDSFTFPERGVCIIGSEETGISPEARRLVLSSAGIVSIRLYGAKGSLNVSAASAIMLARWASLSGSSGKAP